MPHVCELTGRFLRIAARAMLLALAVMLVAEMGLRLAGFQPQNLERVGFVATMPDGFTQWQMRTNVRINEYAVTNNFGLHEDRDILLQKPPGVRRVAVVGSSVVWAIGEPLENTISRATERLLRARGCNAEVLNFGAHGFNILNAVAYVQTKVHQFNPDAVVMVMDLQMINPGFEMRPNREPPEPVRKLGWAEALFKRASEYSVVLSWLDNPAAARPWLARFLPSSPKPAKVAAPAPPRPNALTNAWDEVAGSLASLAGRLKARVQEAPLVVRPAPVLPEPVETLETYEAKRERELGALVGSVSAFAREMGFPIYFTTPYGPYYHATDAEFAKFSLAAVALVAPLYGGVQPAARRETEIASAVIARAAPREGARVVDMLELTRAAKMADGDFSTDGIHFSPQGYRRVGTLVAERLLKDGFCAGAAAPRPGG